MDERRPAAEPPAAGGAAAADAVASAGEGPAEDRQHCDAPESGGHAASGPADGAAAPAGHGASAEPVIDPDPPVPDFVFFLSYRGVLPASSEERLILPSVCTRQQASFARRQLLPLGLQGEDARVPPPALAARGVDAAAWAEAARRLRDEVLPLQGPVDRPDCLGSPRLFDFMPAFISMCTPLVLLMLPFYPLAALYDARRAARFQRALGGWLDDLNARLLRPVGCFARLQTSVVVIPGVIPGFYRYRGERIGDQPAYVWRSWLAVSTSEADAEKLRAERVRHCSHWRAPGVLQPPPGVLAVDAEFSGPCCCLTPTVV